MPRKVIQEITTPKGIVRIYTELRDGEKNPVWFASLAMENGIVFSMIRKDSEITTAEALKMV